MLYLYQGVNAKMIYLLHYLKST